MHQFCLSPLSAVDASTNVALQKPATHFRGWTSAGRATDGITSGHFEDSDSCTYTQENVRDL